MAMAFELLLIPGPRSCDNKILSYLILEDIWWSEPVISDARVPFVPKLRVKRQSD